MSAGYERMDETPLQALQQIASTTEEDTSWSDVLNRITEKRIAHAKAEAEVLDGRNPRERRESKISGLAFVAVLAIMATIDAAQLTTSDRWSELHSTQVIFALVRYIFYAAVAFFSTAFLLDWIFSARETGHPRWREVKRYLYFNDTLKFLKISLSVSLVFLFLSFFSSSEYLTQILYAMTALFLFLALFSIVSGGRPMSVLFVGVATQRHLVLHYRLAKRLDPLIVKSCFLTNLKGAFCGLIVNSKHSYVDNTELIQQVGSAAYIAKRIVIDAQLEVDSLKEIIKKIKNAQSITRQIYILISDSPAHTTLDRLKEFEDTYDIEGTYVKEQELLSQITPIWVKHQTPTSTESDNTRPS